MKTSFTLAVLLLANCFNPVEAHAAAREAAGELGENSAGIIPSKCDAVSDNLVAHSLSDQITVLVLHPSDSLTISRAGYETKIFRRGILSNCCFSLQQLTEAIPAVEQFSN